MKIMYDYQIFASQRYGGVSRYFVKLAKTIEENCNCRIHTPILFGMNEYLSEIKKSKKIFKNGIFRKVFLNKYIFDYSVGINKLINLHNLKHKSYDVIHPTWTDPYINEYCAGRMVVTIHDMIHELLWKDSDFTRKEIENKKKAIYDADAIIAISNNTKKDILEIYPDIPADKITVIYHGANKLPHPVRPIAFPVPERYILFVGGRKGYKRGIWTTDVLKRLMEYDNDIYVLYIGGGKLSDKEIDFFKKECIENRILQYNASDSELAYIYKNAICLLYPTLYEGFGFPILEAFDNDCPVICTNSSSLPEVGGDAALYFEENDIEQIVEYVRSLSGDTEFRRECLDKGRRQVKKFSWERCAVETMQVYQKVAHKNSKCV